MTTTREVKGLVLSVFRNADLGDCTLGGITATHDKVTVVGVLNLADPELKGVIVPVADWRANPVRDDAPPVIVVVRRSGVWRDGEMDGYLAPVELRDGLVHRRHGGGMGGNYAGGGPSQFRQVLTALLGYPAPDVLRVHDRFEG